jgi:hypothetical protein
MLRSVVEQLHGFDAVLSGDWFVFAHVKKIEKRHSLEVVVFSYKDSLDF